jgi:hypothetical protein
MLKSRFTLIIILLLVIMSFILTGAATVKWKPLNFDNPGTKRLVKSTAGNYFFFRSLPEETLLLKVKDLSSIEIRVVSKAKVSNPDFTIYFNNTHVTYKLKLLAVSEKFQVFEPVKVDLPAGVTQAELLCYDRNIYFRAFMPVVIVPKAKVPALKITAKSRDYMVTGPGTQHIYYGFNPSANLTFQIRKGVPFTLYIRAELTSKYKPVFELYEDGKLIGKYELSLKSTNYYTTEGIAHLTIGKKLDFPVRDKPVIYELKSQSGHLFLARPVVKKVK